MINKAFCRLKVSNGDAICCPNIREGDRELAGPSRYFSKNICCRVKFGSRNPEEQTLDALNCSNDTGTC